MNRSPWPVVATVCVGAFMAALDASIVNLALPTMKADLHTTLADIEWVAIAYMLTLTALLPTLGKLADIFGRVRMYRLGFVVFVIGSALCGAAPTLLTLNLARVVQGVGASFLQANSVAIITAAAPPELRGRAIGVQGAAQAIGLAVGPTVGGILLAAFSWRAIFFVNVPVGAFGILLGLLFLSKVPETARTEAFRFDYTGAALLALTAVPLFWVITQGYERGWTSPLILAPSALGLVLGTALVLWERRFPQPLLDPLLFRIRTFVYGNATGLISFALMYGTLFLMPFYLENVRHLPPAKAGWLLTTVPLAMALSTPFAGSLADRFGAQGPLLAGAVISVAALVGLTQAHEATAFWAIGLALALVGLGQGLFTPPNNASVMGSVPRSHLGLTGGILNMARSLGTSTGVAVAGTVYGLYLQAGVARSQDPKAELLALRMGYATLVGLGLVFILLVFLGRARGAEGAHEQAALPRLQIKSLAERE